MLKIGILQFAIFISAVSVQAAPLCGHVFESKAKVVFLTRPENLELLRVLEERYNPADVQLVRESIVPPEISPKADRILNEYDIELTKQISSKDPDAVLAHQRSIFSMQREVLDAFGVSSATVKINNVDHIFIQTRGSHEINRFAKQLYEEHGFFISIKETSAREDSMVYDPIQFILRISIEDLFGYSLKHLMKRFLRTHEAVMAENIDFDLSYAGKTREDFPWLGYENRLVSVRYSLSNPTISLPILKNYKGPLLQRVLRAQNLEKELEIPGLGQKIAEMNAWNYFRKQPRSFFAWQVRGEWHFSTHQHHRQVTDVVDQSLIKIRIKEILKTLPDKNEPIDLIYVRDREFTTSVNLLDMKALRLVVRYMQQEGYSPNTARFIALDIAKHPELKDSQMAFVSELENF